MPVSRYQIRNVYRLADPELYKAADKDDPEALLEGVAMAGLVGVLRQLGDLAEFAAEIFHNLHEEVTATAARGHGLLERVQQLELEIPSIEKAHLSQTSHSTFFPNSGIDWHPNRQTTQNLITTGDLPRFVMDSYEECLGPPRLFLLDKFDVGGAGACLKRYSDPSFYKLEVSSYEIESAETRRDKKIHKNKKKGSQWKAGGTPQVLPPSHAKLHQLFLEDRVQNGTIESTHRVKLKKRPNKSPFDSKSEESSMNKLLNSPSEGKIVHQIRVHPSLIPVPSATSNQSKLEIFEDTIGSPFKFATPSRSPSLSSSACRNPPDNLAIKVTAQEVSDPTTSSSSEVDEKKIVMDEEIESVDVQNGYRSDDVASEMDNYIDALATTDNYVDALAIAVNSPPQIIGTTEIPFRPRVPPEKIPVNQVNLEKGSTKEEDLNKDNESLENEEHETNYCSTAGSLLSFQFVRNYGGEVENEHRNDGSSPMIHVPNILETTDRISEDNHSTGSLDSRCSLPHSVISRPFGVLLAEHDSVDEEFSDSSDSYLLLEEQLKEIGDDDDDDDDDVLHISDAAKARVSYLSQNETELNKSETEDLDDADKSTESKERDIGLVNSEIEVRRTHVFVPDDADENDDYALSTSEDETELEGKETDSVDSEKMEKNATGLLPFDIDKNEDNACCPVILSVPDDVDGNDENALSTLEDETELEGKETDSVDSEKMENNDAGFLPLDIDINEDNACIIQDSKESDDDSSSFLQDQNRQQESVLHDLSNQDLESKSMNHGDEIDISESGTHVDHEDTHSEPYSVNLPSQSVPQEEDGHGIDLFDQVKHQFHEEDPEGKPIPESVPVPVPDKLPTLELQQASSHDINLFDQVKPQLPPVKLEDNHPLPPLPPMQWRMRKLQSGGQLIIDHNFPPVFQSKPTEGSQVAGPMPLDEIKNPKTKNENFKDEASLHIENHDKSSEKNFAEILVPKDDEMPTGIRPMKIQRPLSPLIEAVAAHDKSKLRKVSGRLMSQITKGRENDKLLEQIRTKSYKLKPVVQNRPNIHGPTTNVRLAAILEKANAIRQAFAGSDDDDDDNSDSWSDS